MAFLSDVPYRAAPVRVSTGQARRRRRLNWRLLLALAFNIAAWAGILFGAAALF